MKEIFIPSLRGVFGDWVFYSSLFPLKEIASRINFAEDIHQNKSLSKLIQRKLEESRGKEISNYLSMEKERFFNSLVVAVYGGNPQWYEASLKVSDENIKKESISEDAMHSVGFLKLSGSEKLFALDGQHRLSGIKLAIKSKNVPDDDELNVILVGHKNNREGIQRTRRLFTTLNKRAVSVKKEEIIALDENDLIAIITRKLVEESNLFYENRIAYKSTNNISKKDMESLTTIGNLYDVLKIIFGEIKGEKFSSRQYAARPDDSKIEDSYKFSIDFFEKAKETFPSLKEYFETSELETVIRKYRNEDGGNVLFRPIGLTIIIDLISQISSIKSLDDAFSDVKDIDLKLTSEPFKNTIWDDSRKVINPKGKNIARDMLLVKYGVITDSKKIEKIKGKYNSFVD